jgi:O-antigen/teichoic acid export membrane protein
LTSSSAEGFWALADQAAVSLGMFACNILLARKLSAHEYGIYGILLGVMLALNTIHAALVSYPLALTAADTDHGSFRHSTGAALSVNVLLALPFGGVLLATAALLGRPHLWACSFAALLFWQGQETLRRSLMAQMRHREAMLGDAISYLGQGAVIWLFAAGAGFGLEAVFLVMAVTSALAMVLGACQTRVRGARSGQVKAMAGAGWSLGRWMLLANLGSVFSLQSFAWALAAARGPAESARFQAAANLLGVTHPVMFGLGSLIVPGVARACAAPGAATAWHWAWKQGLRGAVLLAPYFAILWFWPQLVLAAFYTARSPYLDLELPVRVLAAAYVFAFTAHILGAYLNGSREPKAAFLAEAAGAMMGAAVGVPLALLLGVSGACAGLACAQLARAGSSAWLVRRRGPRGAALTATA